jgi:hypothetical protein
VTFAEELKRGGDVPKQKNIGLNYVKNAFALKNELLCTLSLPYKMTKTFFEIVVGQKICQFHLQWAPLNGITLGPRQTDSINRMIPLTDTHIALLRTNRPWIPKKN